MNILRPESYLSPFLLSYLSKYIKNIEQKNLQLSLWGGDAVLNNLEFNLGVLDNELGKLPFSFVSCQAQELRIHVPWNKLTSEPIVITLNTVECVVKLNCHKTLKREKSVEKPKDLTSSSQSSYVEMLISKIKRNVSFVVNNLILKYVEEDIVLSVNIHSAMYQGVNEIWKPSFIELAESNPVLRYVCKIQDMTICLDKRGRTGHIDAFEDPLVFRCPVELRQHMTFTSNLSRSPSAIKLSVMLDRYNLSISEVQLPAMLHLMELCLRLYYQQIDIQHSYVEDNPAPQGDVSSDQGWASWAWSYVPPIMSYDGPEDSDTKCPVIAVGIYIKTFVTTFKLSRTTRGKQFHRSENYRSHFLAQIKCEGISVELVAKGLEFFSCDASFANFNFVCSSSVAIESMNPLPEQSLLIASAGSTVQNFGANSLFDFRSPENNSAAFPYIFSKEEYFDVKSYNASYAFSSKYLYIAADGRDNSSDNHVEFNDFLRLVHLTDFKVWPNTREQSWKQFRIGGEHCTVILSSYTKKCVELLLKWACSHSHKEYPLKTQEVVKPPNTSDCDLLSFVPNRAAIVEVRNIVILIPASHHYDIHRLFSLKTLKCITPSDNHIAAKATQVSYCHTNYKAAKLPCIMISVPFANMGMQQPMYADHLAAYLSTFLSPPRHLMKCCNTQYTMQSGAINIALANTDILHFENSQLYSWSSSVLSLELLQFESHVLQASSYFQKWTSMLHSLGKCTLQTVTSTFTLLEMELLLHVVDSWLHMINDNLMADYVLDISSIPDLRAHDDQLFVNFCSQGLIIERNESFACTFISGAIQSLDMYLNRGSVMYPLLQSSDKSRKACYPDDFVGLNRSTLSESKITDSMKSMLPWDESTSCSSFYVQLPNNELENGCLLVDLHHIDVCIDGCIITDLADSSKLIIQDVIPSVWNKKRSPVDDHHGEDEVISIPLSWYKKFLQQVVQLHTSGIQVFFLDIGACIDKNQSLSTSLHWSVVHSILKSGCSSQVFSICFPEVTAFTAGHKRVPVHSNLMQKGVLVNKFMEFGTINLGLENAFAFTVSTVDGEHADTWYTVKPCSAACTVVNSIAKSKDDEKANVSIHLDVEPIEFKMSSGQLQIQVNLLEKLVSSVQDFKCKVNCISKDNESGEPDIMQTSKASVSTFHHPNTAENSKPLYQAVAVNKSVVKPLPFSIWLQCTATKVSLSIYDVQQDLKTVICIEDISLSLDNQVVYLKVMASFTTCFLHQFRKIGDDWHRSDYKGLSISPMFSAIPTFIQENYVPQQSLPLHIIDLEEAENAIKPGKFFDVTFTQALVSDYQKHVSGDMGFNDTVSEASSLKSQQSFVIPMKQYVNEIILNIQAVDVIATPRVIYDLLDVFHPLTNFIDARKTSASGKNALLEFPRLYMNLGGLRLLLPRFDKSDVSHSENSPDDVLMICLGRLDINPQPVNPLSRVILANAVYKKAKSSGLLHHAGSCVEDKQLECKMKDISIGTSNWASIVKCIEKPTVSENPALHWDTIDNFAKVLEPEFHPIVEQFDLLSTFAPTISFFNHEHQCIDVCASSLEVNLTSDCIIHVNLVQTAGVIVLLTEWLMDHCEDSSNQKISREMQCGHVQAEEKEVDSVGETSCSYLSSRPVMTSQLTLMGEVLITGQRIKILCYQQDRINVECILPLFLVDILQPTFFSHVSKSREKIEFQVHDASLNVCTSTEANSKIDLRNCTNYPLNVFEAQSGNVDERTGVPYSLLMVSANNFLTKKASILISVERAVKIRLNDQLFEKLNVWLPELHRVPFVRKALSSERSHANQEFSVSGIQLFSKLTVLTDQIVAEIVCANDTHRISYVYGSVDVVVDEMRTTTVAKMYRFAIRLKHGDTHFSEVLLPLSIKCILSVSTIPNVAENLKSRHLNLDVSPVFLRIHPQVIQSMFCLREHITSWVDVIMSHFQTEPNSTLTVLSTPTKATIIASKDDLRTGSYTYVSSNDVCPLPGQIVFSQLEDIGTMTWCNRRPVKVKHIRIIPILFNRSMEKKDGDICCSLEYYDEVSEMFKSVHKFLLSETDPVDFHLSENSSVEATVSTKWRVVIFDSEMPAAMLAASLQVDCEFDSSSLPWMSVGMEMEEFTACSSSLSKLDIVDCAKLKMSGLKGGMYLQKVCTDFSCSVQLSASLTVHLMEYHYMTWLPFILPSKLNIKLGYSKSSVIAQCDFPTAIELHVSQFAIISLQALADSWMNTCNSLTGAFSIHNLTDKTLLFGQSSTAECISIGAGDEVIYSWRSNKVDPVLHLAVESLSNWSWCESFSLREHGLVERVIDNEHCVVISVQRSEGSRTTVSFLGCTRLINMLQYDVDVQLQFSDDIQRFALLSGGMFARHLLCDSSTIKTICYAHPDQEMALTSQVDCHKLSTKQHAFMNFPRDSGLEIYAQICCFKQDCATVLVLAPIFMVRSHLPCHLELHVETRSQGKSANVCVKGHGTDLQLSEFSPHVTHHVAVQLIGSNSPFDVSIPMHSSLIDSIPDSCSFENATSLNLNSKYPYNNLTYNSDNKEKWRPDDGWIQAKLSVYCHSLLLEITPWCLFCNQTGTVLCVTSSEGSVTVVQPGEVAVPHHFIGPFRIRATNSMPSDWFTLQEESDHPSRSLKLNGGHICNGSTQQILLQKRSCVYDLQMRARINHGIFVLTICPTWTFMSTSTCLKDIIVSPSLDYISTPSNDCDSKICVDAQNPVGVHAWKLPTNLVVSCDALDQSHEDNVQTVSNESTSSFLCVGSDQNMSSLVSNVKSRVLHIISSDATASVTVNDEFTRKIVTFGNANNTMSYQLVLVKQFHGELAYLVLNDIKQPSHVFFNHTSMLLQIQECSEPKTAIIWTIQPSGKLEVESTTNATQFPHCRKKFLCMDVQIAVDNSEQWTNFHLDSRPVCDEIVLTDGIVLWVNIVHDKSVNVHFYDKPNIGCIQETIATKSVDIKVCMHELKFICFDDSSSPMYSVDILHCSLNDFNVDVAKFIDINTWSTKLSLARFQIVNNLSKKYPVFLTSNVSDRSRSEYIFLQIAACLSDDIFLKTVDIKLSVIELQSDDQFLKILAHLLHEYTEAIKQQKFESENSSQCLPVAVRKNVQAICVPVRLQSIVIHPFHVVVTLTTSKKIDVTVHKGSLQFSKFVCYDVDATWLDIADEISRHYVADAIYGAGWFLGSVDLIGNPMTTLRSFSLGIRDLFMMPYESFGGGPIAFVGGLTGGLSSLMRHVSVGMLQSITNVASGLSRNLNSVTQSQKQEVYAYIPDSQIKIHLPYASNASASPIPSSYISGFGKALVKVVTKPIGGAAALVSKAGETIIWKVGLNENYSPKYMPVSHSICSYEHSLQKLSQNLNADNNSQTSQCIFAMTCSMYNVGNVELKTVWALTHTDLLIVRSEDNTLENIMNLNEIEMVEDAGNQCHITMRHADTTSSSAADVKACDSKVAAYLGFEAEVGRSSASVLIDMPTYFAVIHHSSDAKLFRELYHVLKPRKNTYYW